jgi:prepilin-type processing-associated H-X9-DG protein
MSYTNPPVVQVPPPKKSNTGLTIAIVLAVAAVPVLLICMGVLVGLLLPAVQASREAARRMQCTNNLKQIALAMHNYESMYRRLPPAYTTDENGQPLHSWRTLILPFIEQQALYDSIDLSKPWDDPVNQQAAATVVHAYRCPSAPGEASNTTEYQVVVDPRSLFPGAESATFGSAIDGLSNTVMVVETPESLAVPWMSPHDCDMAEYLGYAQSNHTGGFNVAMGDGSVRLIGSQTNTEVRQSMVTRNGNELVPLD